MWHIWELRTCPNASLSEVYALQKCCVLRLSCMRRGLTGFCLLGAQAYTEAFQPDDDVALIVHSSYGDHFWERKLQDAMSNSSGPAVLFFQVPWALHLHTAPA